VAGNMTAAQEEEYIKKPPTDIELRTSKVEQIFYLLDRTDSTMVPRTELARFFVEFYAAIGQKLSDYDLDSMLKLVRKDQFDRVQGDEFVKFVLTFTMTFKLDEFLKGVNEVLRTNNLLASRRPSVVPPLPPLRT
jgi:Ca2+-binding EF-hand superfamily protein